MKNRNVSGSIGWLSILGTISRRNSWSAGIRRSQPEPHADRRAAHPDEPDAEVEERADDRADGRRDDPDPVVEQDRARRTIPTLYRIGASA